MQIIWGQFYFWNFSRSCFFLPPVADDKSSDKEKEWVCSCKRMCHTQFLSSPEQHVRSWRRSLMINNRICIRYCLDDWTWLTLASFQISYRFVGKYTMWRIDALLFCSLCHSRYFSHDFFSSQLPLSSRASITSHLKEITKTKQKQK